MIGALVGAFEGAFVVGAFVGALVGTFVGVFVGALVGALVGGDVQAQIFVIKLLVHTSLEPSCPPIKNCNVQAQKDNKKNNWLHFWERCLHIEFEDDCHASLYM